MDPKIFIAILCEAWDVRQIFNTYSRHAFVHRSTSQNHIVSVRQGGKRSIYGLHDRSECAHAVCDIKKQSGSFWSQVRAHINISWLNNCQMTRASVVNTLHFISDFSISAPQALL